MTTRPAAAPDADALRAFEEVRADLRRLAYRMLGSAADAEDAVQDAYLRWHRADRGKVESPRAFLSKTVTRLCLDRLKAARAQREVYDGPWLPEPVTDLWPAPAEPDAEIGDDLTVAFLLTLERLSPLERAAFLLHDVFGASFAEVSETLQKSEAGCRQLASRARRHIQEEKPRFTADREEARRIADAFLAASAAGDAAALKSLLAETANLRTDGGGQRTAARRVLAGSERCAEFLTGLARKGMLWGDIVYRGRINGLPGFVMRQPDGLLQSVAVEIADGRITEIYIVRNPDKLRHLEQEIAAYSAGSFSS